MIWDLIFNLSVPAIFAVPKKSSMQPMPLLVKAGHILMGERCGTPCHQLPTALTVTLQVPVCM